MKNLDQLVKEYGRPDILVDHWDSSSKSYAVWGYKNQFIYQNNEVLINGEKIIGDPLTLWQNCIDDWKKKSCKDLSAFGFFSYDFKQHLFKHINFKNISTNQPDIWFVMPDNVVEYKTNIKTQRHGRSKKLELIRNLPKLSKYQQKIHKIKEHLLNGDAYQINYTEKMEFKINEDPLSFFLGVRQDIRPHYGCFINLGDACIVSFSPERFFKTHQGFISSYPMKGTRPRFENENEDREQIEDLKHSDKDRAEHIMIVDLLRNDIGKISELGSVEVNNLFSIESFETVHQMVSEVRGKLAKNIKENEIIKAMFPGGSITGAPKEISMKIIDTLENYGRGIYTGAIGKVSSNGEMDFSIAIRTLFVENSKGIYPVGGGIVWDSNAKEEYDEAYQKSKILLNFIEK